MLNRSKRNFNEFQTALYEHAKSIQQNVRFESQTILENIQQLKHEKFKDFQVLLYKFKEIQGLEILFSNSRTFKDFQVLYEPCNNKPLLDLNGEQFRHDRAIE
jgi:hypothetical protein